MGRFDVLKQVKKPEGEAAAGDYGAPVPTSKRGSPHYRQFSAYLRADLYRKLKIKVAERDMDLSDAINEAVETWLGAPTAEKLKTAPAGSGV